VGGYLMALGYGGQYLILVPDRNLIMVVTSGLRLQDFFAPEDLLTDFVLPASESDEPLPPNPSGVGALNERIAAWARPDPSGPVPPLPAMAWHISDRVYGLAPSSVGWRTVSLRFREGQSSATFTADGVSFGVGLDGVYRATAPSPELQVPQDSARMLRGRWRDDSTFVMDFFIVGRPSRYTETFHFQEESLTLSEDVYITGERFVTSGQTLGRKGQRSQRQRQRTR